MTVALLVWYLEPTTGAQSTSPAPDTLRRPGSEVAITAADCTSAKVGTSIETSAVGEPVRSVTLSSPAWVEAAGGAPAHCRVDGTMAPVDTNSTARPINFRVVLPASWSRRAAQIGGGGMNGSIPNLTGGGPGQPASAFARGYDEVAIEFTPS